MSNGGVVASRGFIFQAIIAIIECLKRTDWDEVKMEPPTKFDKVDIQLYQNGNILSAIQVKSSINDFQRADARKWLKLIRQDSSKAKEVQLFLVGDSYTASCRQYIQNEPEIKTIPFEDLQRYCISELVIYIQKKELGNKVSVADLESIYRNLFAETIMNSIASRKISRTELDRIFLEAVPTEKYEENFKQLMAAYHAPSMRQCLTPIPLIDKEIGLVGREDVLGDIRRMLDENSCIVLVSGLGGIGKTAVMQGVCNDLKNNDHYVAWINCGDSLQDDLLMLRDAFSIPKEKKADEAYEAVKAGIQRLGKKLYLFMDDLSREVNKAERDILNALGAHVMITSRKENLPFPKKKLGCLADQDAVKMFYIYYGGDDEHSYEDTVRGIIEFVNSHTLLVELLAKAAKEEGGRLDDFYEKLRKDGFFDVSEEELETEHDNEDLTIEESVIRLYKISKLSEEQRRIMKLFTIFTPEKEIYYKVREWAGFGRKEMKKLVELGWLDRGGIENGYHIHQIVKDSLARQVGEVKLEDYGVFLDKVIDTDSYLGQEVSYDKVSERLVLAEDVARFFNECSRVDADAGTLFNNLAVVYDDQGNYAKALEYYGKALVISTRVLGTDHPHTAVAYSNLAKTYYAQGDYGKALEYHKKALAIRERVLGAEHPSTAKTYNNMAGVFAAQGDYGKALEYYGKAMAFQERVLGTGHLDTATTYNNMALVHVDLGDYGKALEYHKKVLNIREQMLGTDHLDTAVTYNNMGIVYYKKGDYEKSLYYYEKALVIRERMLGAVHPATATTYNNMGELFWGQGDYDKALECHKKALAIKERVFGTEHPSTATTYNNIGALYYKLGKYRKALVYYKEALAIRARMLGTEHPSTATTYNNMAEVFRALGDYRKALEYYKKANEIVLSVFGEEHPHTQDTAQSIKIMEYLQSTGMTENELMEKLKRVH